MIVDQYFDLTLTYPNFEKLPIDLNSPNASNLEDFMDSDGNQYKVREDVKYFCYRHYRDVTEYYDAHDGSFVKILNSRGDEIKNFRTW